MSTYRGRFAPSPTGPLHFGSLIAAVGSYLEARTRGGDWLVRMEDLDRPREAPGAADEILRALEVFGFEWDEPVLYQSRREFAYGEALAHLKRRGAVFACACSRKEIADSISAFGANSARAHDDGTQAKARAHQEVIYPGACRNGVPEGREARVLRLRIDDETIAFDDALQGRIEQNLAREVGDFVVRRGDGLYAYQLAVVVDDAEQEISDVVRGADLLGSTPRQIFLQRLLRLPTPRYLHLPVAVDEHGEKLGKQTLAAPLDVARAGESLARALAFLGNAPPEDLRLAGVAEIWDWAIEHWDAQRIPRRRSAPVMQAG
jgi:glutamyl-Q tRNA(Asp) synthetase